MSDDDPLFRLMERMCRLGEQLPSEEEVLPETAVHIIKAQPRLKSSAVATNRGPFARAGRCRARTRETI